MKRRRWGGSKCILSETKKKHIINTPEQAKDNLWIVPWMVPGSAAK